MSELLEESKSLKGFEKNKKLLDKLKWTWYNSKAVWDSEAMNHDNLRLNSTHNPENSHIFLARTSKAKFELRKIAHLVERSETMVLHMICNEISENNV